MVRAKTVVLLNMETNFLFFKSAIRHKPTLDLKSPLHTTSSCRLVCGTSEVLLNRPLSIIQEIVRNGLTFARQARVR